MATVSDFDIAVIGGGPGGYSTAIRAAQLGFSTVLVESAELGGVCLNWGCIPTKALLHCAELIADIGSASQFGIEASVDSIDLEAMVRHSRQTAGKLSKGVEFLLRKNKVTHLSGHGSIPEKGKLAVTTSTGEQQEYRVPHIIVATGARLKQLPSLPSDDSRIWDARAAMTATTRPDHLVVIGAGAIGVEFASFYSDIGAQVTLVEAADRVVPTEDPEISERMAKALAKRGIDCRTRTRFASMDAMPDSLTVNVTKSDGSDGAIACDRLLVAVGVDGNIEGMGLEALGLDTDKGSIVTGAYGETNVAGVYAIGDVAGAPWLAHKAVHEGIACIEHIAGMDIKPAGERLIPGCIYARPQIASIGLSEPAAKAAGKKIKVGRFDLTANGKALAAGHSDGLIKTIVDQQTGELLGAHMIGHGVSEQIQGFALAMGAEITTEEFAETVFPHPTISEAMHEAVLDAEGIAVNH
ncbi:dihydrolipoyl dehydrogenase [Luminiphilus syltensis NOR5-1B]|uniref:Dihydrolipoyl dehydrogenase n=1 Tax=Luminiphilus syltensis NOR5-1B TaxID=565045 RepID=B8KSQ0_9GAMM|nr:dihydrolipoyl dehydrogenase [Luminiphilus syltensis]EED34723.1 dihydrolipoyl dehydrogenase [Luminiphilus syltensis NOR5-1B]